MNRIKKGDTVIIIAGKSKGHIGKALSVEAEKVTVEGANIIKKHLKPNPQLQQKGGIISREAPLHISNLALYNPVTKKADRVGFKFLETAGILKKVRVFKSNNEVIDRV